MKHTATKQTKGWRFPWGYYGQKQRGPWKEKQEIGIFFGHRIRKAFLFIPKFIRGANGLREWRWLEYAEWRDARVHADYINGTMAWFGVEWLN